jgi:hypothetical protein
MKFLRRAEHIEIVEDNPYSMAWVCADGHAVHARALDGLRLIMLEHYQAAISAYKLTVDAEDPEGATPLPWEIVS